MRCILCRAEMRVEQVEQDEGMKAAGYEHRTFRCNGCAKTERRLAFSGEGTTRPLQPPISQLARNSLEKVSVLPLLDALCERA